MQIQNHYATLPDRLYHKQSPTSLQNPKLAHFNHALAECLGSSFGQYHWEDIISGQHLPKEFDPLAMAYAGHQFGQWAGQLGDGRGLLLAQVIDKKGKLQDLHLKGAGLTPYSRRGDGRAVIRSTVREYLCGHTLTSLGVPSSIALGFAVSDSTVWRERAERGATLLRVSDCHVRFGHFEWICAYAPQLLPDFTKQMMGIYYPACQDIGSFLNQITQNTAHLIADWQSVGFVHGVMNTDNLNITGSTIDFGPFGFMQRFDPTWINNHSDYTGRYVYQNQPTIGHWNIQKLLGCFVGLMDKAELTAILAQYEPCFFEKYTDNLLLKLGVDGTPDNAKKQQLITIGYELLGVMAEHQLDFTNTFCALSGAVYDTYQTDKTMTKTPTVAHAISLYQALKDNDDFCQWHNRYVSALDSLGIDKGAVIDMLCQNNPVYVLRNPMAQRAIETAEQDNFDEVGRLFTLLTNPYKVQKIATPQDTTPPAIGERVCAVSCSS